MISPRAVRSASLRRSSTDAEGPGSGAGSGGAVTTGAGSGSGSGAGWHGLGRRRRDRLGRRRRDRLGRRRGGGLLLGLRLLGGLGGLLGGGVPRGQRRRLLLHVPFRERGRGGSDRQRLHEARAGDEGTD